MARARPGSGLRAWRSPAERVTCHDVRDAEERSGVLVLESATGLSLVLLLITFVLLVLFRRLGSI
jgi:hypothetical protein